MLTLYKMVEMKFGSVEMFANAIGQKRSTVWWMLNPKRKRTQREIDTVAYMLDLPEVMVDHYLRGNKHPSDEIAREEANWLAKHTQQLQDDDPFQRVRSLLFDDQTGSVK